MAKDTSHKEYLGDSVYVDHDGYYLILTTENGIQVSNTIYLEPDVWTNLEFYVEKILNRDRESREAGEAAKE